MSNGINNMDDLLDDGISRSLSELGFIFPKTLDDFKILDNQAKSSKIIQPDSIKDPFKFFGKRAFKSNQLQGHEYSQTKYLQSFAQAAREGNVISDEIKRKMTEDKQKSRRNEKEE